MASRILTPEARLENIKALALAAGITPEQAAERLDGRVLCTFDCGDAAACEFYQELRPVLARTIEVHNAPDGGSYLVEMVIGDVQPLGLAPAVFARLTPDGCCFASQPVAAHSASPAHRALSVVAACYGAGVAVYRAVGEGIPNPPPDHLEIRYDDILPDRGVLEEPVDLGVTHLAGAGAIGNGFLWAARHVELLGKLIVCDDDVVSSGNLQRQVWFDEDDTKDPKSPTLCQKAQPYIPGCELKPEPMRLQDLPSRSGAWLRRLIVAVDSRRARRELQAELPAEVIDASTTDIREVVVHYNDAFSGLACLGCLYKADEKEASQDQIIADHLGVSVDDVKASRISPAAAAAIVRKHPHIDPASIEGQAFDSLYKTLCATGKLHASVGSK
ncbi:ThiF family adenylyltransferase [Bradyrhizobium elkanii]|uniref:ThiF family adenylyltransferase n=1 Tax=Bradyrhizobium elkanii TaxID=29448 RepID=UPI003515BEF1